jgi:hypothetical protein
MQNLENLKTELEMLRQENAPLHNMYVFFKVETPENTYHLTMPADRFLEYIDRGIIFSKDGAAGMAADVAETYHALVWEQFINGLKANFNEFAKSDGIYRCEITAVHGMETELDPAIALMGELVMGEYALAIYKNANPAMKRLEQSVQEDYGDFLDGGEYRFTYTKTEAANSIDGLKNIAAERIEYENTDDRGGGVYAVEENDLAMERRYDGDGS